MPAGRLLLCYLIAFSTSHGTHAQQAITHTEFIYSEAPFPSAHASTIVETKRGLVTAWFGGTAEGNIDVSIWLSRHDGNTWSKPVEVANGIQPDGKRYPCWNPVLFQPSSGPLLLFYKVGLNPREWWGLVRISNDDGHTWSEAMRLPDGILGPIRSKPVELSDRTLLAGSSTEHDGWVAHIERFTPHEKGWTLGALGSSSQWWRSTALNKTADFAAIQPTILTHSGTRLQVLCRSRQNVITEAWSGDSGSTWSQMASTLLPNPSSGIDALRLNDGQFLLVHNATARGRHKLAVSLSDDGRTWRKVQFLEDAATGEYSYPAVIQTDDGTIHITYTWKRKRIKHVIMDPGAL